MSFNSNEDALNFLLDEFFIYRGLEELEKYSKNQKNELELIMQNCYEILNDINKIQSNIQINEKMNNIKKSSSIKSYTYNSNENIKLKNKIPNKKDQNYIRRLKNNIDINTLFRKRYMVKSTLKAEDSGIFNNDKNIINLRRQHSSNYSKNKTKLIKTDRTYLSVRNSKMGSKPKERNLSKKTTTKHFTISLID